MRRIYNLTDVPEPGHAALKRARPKKDHRVGTEMVKPGKWVDVPDNFPLRSISGLIQAGALAVDAVPKWYIDAKSSNPTPKPAKPEAEAALYDVDEESKPKSKPKKKKKSS